MNNRMEEPQISDFSCIRAQVEHCTISTEWSMEGHNSQPNGLNILDLPPEMLLRIFVHIDMRTIFKTVILTCKSFYEILSEQDIWKTLFCLKWQNTKLAKDHEYITNWKDVYFTYDDISTFWKRNDAWKLECKQLHEHSAPIDAVHIMPGSKFAVSGSRDRNVIVWDIDNFAHTDQNDDVIKKATTLSGHKVCTSSLVLCFQDGLSTSGCTLSLKAR